MPTHLKISQGVGNYPYLVGVVYSSEKQKGLNDVGTLDLDTTETAIRASYTNSSETAYMAMSSTAIPRC